MLNSENILLVGALAFVFSGKGLGFGQCARVYEGRSLMPTIFLYRRAVRYLRTKGLSPLTDAELKARGEYAAKSRLGA